MTGLNQEIPDSVGGAHWMSAVLMTFEAASARELD